MKDLVEIIINANLTLQKHAFIFLFDNFCRIMKQMSCMMFYTIINAKITEVQY